MKTEQPRVKDLETMAVLAAACLVFFALFGHGIFLWLAFTLLAGGGALKAFRLGGCGGVAGALAKYSAGW